MDLFRALFSSFFNGCKFSFKIFVSTISSFHVVDNLLDNSLTREIYSKSFKIIKLSRYSHILNTL